MTLYDFSSNNQLILLVDINKYPHMVQLDKEGKIFDTQVKKLSL